MAAGTFLRDILDGLGVGFKGLFWLADTSAPTTTSSLPGFIMFDSTTMLPVDLTASSPTTISAGVATIGAVVQVPRATANGATSSRVVAAATTNATSLKASAGNISQMDLFNVAAYDVFVKFYNKASSPTVGTDTPIWTLPLKAGTGYSGSFLQGKSFATGIAYAITKLLADADTTALVAGDVTGSIDWI